MKKIIIGALAFAMLFSLVSCSGDLHDVNKRDPLVSEYKLEAWERKDAVPDGTRGWVRSLEIVDLEVDKFDEAESATYYKPVVWNIAGEATILVDFAVHVPDGWTTRYEIDGSEEMKADTWYELVEGMEAEKKNGRSYISTSAGGKITVTLKDSDGKLYIKYESDEPKVVKVAYNSDIYEAKLTDPNVYQARVTAASDGVLKVSADYNGVILDSKQINDAIKDKVYVVEINATKGDDKVEIIITLDTPKVFIVGDIAKDNEFVQFADVTEKGYRAYTFTYKSDMTAWGGGNGTLNFQLSSKAGDWSKVFFKNGSTFDAVNGAWLTAEVKDDNCQLTGLEEDVAYMIIVDCSADPDDISTWKAKTIKKPLYIVGDYSGVEGSLLKNSFFPIMNVKENEDSSTEYTYTFKYDSAKMNAWGGTGFKVAPVTDWSESYGGNDTAITITLNDTNWTPLYSKTGILAANNGEGDTGNINFAAEDGVTYSIITKIDANGKIFMKVTK